MSNEFILDQEPNDCGGSGGGGGGLTENISSLETPSSSVSYSVGESNNIGLPYQSDGINGGSIIQSSPPHYRHSRAYRHFKNPPQPHMCIRTTTEHGEELFINVLSWTRIVIPQEASDPIPLYGGMRVPPGSPRSPPVVFAVMANPEVLKDSGRHSKDPEERRAMVELMCDFVEAMNPGVKLIRNAVILKDRDISGELKDVWNAVQAQRDREREEQMIQQRQQQHYHNTTTQQLFPKTQNSSFDESPQNEPQAVSTNIATNGPENKITYTELGPDSTATLKNDKSPELLPKDVTDESAVKESAESAINSVVSEASKDQLPNDVSEQMSLEPALIQVNNIHNSKLCSISNTEDLTKPTSLTNGGGNKKAPTTDVAIPSSTATTNKTPATAPPKKEKLGGFLPNGCILARFKNNKHKDKDKDNSKSTSKDREKNLLHVLKKSKDKQEDTTKTQYEKNCINLESEVEKLDLNKLDTAASNDNMFMKLKVATSAAK
ncbi:uncharacterized protein LOC129911251 [Episyrphus balteatus]|uniref:uncharacterized protein LOC129911251 n=1 Tax=Episyrphus balteatus TaxID=286459 RepID=UPI0024867D30|nr:uncharacterized protein LOC129911251 [Episyrphus balteatus]